MKVSVVLVEGQTEERFVSDVLQPHIAATDTWLQPVVVQTSRTPGGIKQRGGGTSWRHFDRDLRTLLGQSHWHRVAVLLDLYGYPADAPGVDEPTAGPARERHARVVAALGARYGDPRFVPGVALHEFETWVIAAAVGRPALLGQTGPAECLQAVAAGAGDDVELVNGSSSTAPSKRVARCWPGYTKTIDGIAAITEAGLDHVRHLCPALDGWLRRLTEDGSPAG